MVFQIIKKFQIQVIKHKSLVFLYKILDLAMMKWFNKYITKNDIK